MISQSIRLSIHPSVCLSVHLSVCLSVCLSVIQSVRQSVGQSFGQSVGCLVSLCLLGLLVGKYQKSQKNLYLQHSLSPVLHREGPTVCLHLTSPVFLTLYHHHHYHLDIHYIFVPAMNQKSHHSTTAIQALAKIFRCYISFPPTILPSNNIITSYPSNPTFWSHAILFTL